MSGDNRGVDGLLHNDKGGDNLGDNRGVNWV